MPAPSPVQEAASDDDQAEEDLVVEDLLVEEISIDGMCGVY
jgi:mycofactocin precursor